jgi:hypothetical protein
MPLNALNDAIVHHTLTVSQIGQVLTRLVHEEITPTSRDQEASQREMSGFTRFSGFTCPECRGPLYENGGKLDEFRCRVGHMLSLKTLFEEHTSTQERKLYEAIVALEEGAELAERMAVVENGTQEDELRREAEQLRRSAQTLRRVVERRSTPPAD